MSLLLDRTNPWETRPGWGIAVDLNVEQGNLFGQTPHQDPRLVEVFERWGFLWGGTFIEPDGMHFEYRREPAGS